VRLTRVLSILGTHILVASVENILVHERGTRRDLSEERDLNRLADLDSLALLHEDLSRVLASVLSVERGNTVLLRVMTLLERLQSRHEVMSSRHTGGDDTFRDTSGDCTLDDSSHGVHRPDDLVLELRWDVELDLLEEVF
jgi:hypothetical protein